MKHWGRRLGFFLFRRRYFFETKVTSFGNVGASHEALMGSRSGLARLFPDLSGPLTVTF